MSERISFRDLLRNALAGSIRGQILTVLVALLFLGSLTQAALFYARARSIALDQLQESSKNLGRMVGTLSTYDLQFNKQGLKETLKGMIEADTTLLWAEFADPQGKTIQADGPLGKAPYALPAGLVPSVHAETVSTDRGQALLVRVPVRKAAEAGGAGPGELGFETPKAASGPVDLGELRLVMGMQALQTLRRNYLLFGLGCLIATMVLGTVLSYLVTRYLVAPIYSLTDQARRIAGGDFTSAQVAEQRRDELGRLSVTFRDMAAQLSSTLKDIRGAFQRVQADTASVRGQLDRSLKLSAVQDGAAGAVAASLEAIQASVGEVSRQMEGLSMLAEEVSSSVLQMISSIDEIASSADGLTDSVNRAASTLSQNVAAQKQISASAETLSAFVEESSVAMSEMESSIRQIERNALHTREASENVAREAKAGVRAVERSVASVQDLQGSFARTVEVMHVLGQRSEEVGQILAVIDEVMEQTHLLALNAAIIAAQAGEHGKSFAVVAGEIRNLAEKTSLSTREISALVASVQSEVHKAVETVTAQSSVLEQSAADSREIAASFKRIEGSVAPAVEMVQEIARATTEQSKGAEGVARSLEQVRDLAHQLGKATSEQSAGSGQLLEAVTRIRGLAEEVKRATREQSAGSALIREAMDRLTAAVGAVLAQANTQTEAARGAGQALEKFGEASRAGAANIREAGRQMEALSERAEDVGRELARFRTEGE